MESIPDAVLPLVYIAASAAVKLLAVSSTGRRQRIPKRAECVGRVTQMAIYPAKSMDGLQVNEAMCTYTGLKLTDADIYDRRFLLTVGDDYRFVTARQCPTLLLVKTSLDKLTGRLYFEAQGMERFSVPIVPDFTSVNDCKTTKVWGQQVLGWDCGPEAADWFTRFLSKRDGKNPDEKYRLLYNTGNGLRNIDRKSTLHVNDVKSSDQLIYHDDGPFLMTTESSMSDLTRRLADSNADPPVTMDYFRPSITVQGESSPFDEDNWDEVFIGDAKFTRFMPCARCLLTTIDPVKGEVRKDGEPLKTLRSYRIIQPGSQSPCFGIYLVCDREATIRVNDDVYILRRRSNWT